MKETRSLKGLLVGARGRWLVGAVAWLALGPIGSGSAGTLPANDPQVGAAMARAIAKALPPGSTAVEAPLAVDLGEAGVGPGRGPGRVYVVLYRKGPNDPLFRGLVLVPGGNDGYRAAALPESLEDVPSGQEEITTAVLASELGPDVGTVKRGATQQARGVVILYYTRQHGTTGSFAHGRVYVYAEGRFRIDVGRSRLLEGVRTAAVVRLRLLGE